MALLERESELDGIRGLHAAAAGGRGSLLVVAGVAGAGKTALLSALPQLAPVAVRLSARPSELEVEHPYGVMRDLFEPLLSRAAPERRIALLDGAAALSSQVLGSGQPTSLPAIDPGGALARAFFWLTWNVVQEASGTLQVVVDDVQWADPGSLEALSFLAHRVAELPLLLAVGVRTSEEAAARPELQALVDGPQATRMEPRPLSLDAATRLATERLGAERGGRIAERAHTVTAGNPFLLSETLAHLEATAVAGGDVSLEVPPVGVSRTFLERLRRLGEDAVRLAEAVAVLGDGCALAHAAELASISRERALGVSQQLIDRSLFGNGRALSFVHPLGRAAVYDAAAGPRRAELHRRAGQLLAAARAPIGQVGDHFLRTEPEGDDGVAEHLYAAGARALATGAAGSALRLLRRAHAEPPAPALVTDVMLALLRAAVWEGQVEADDIRELIERLRAGEVISSTARQLAPLMLSFGRVDDALDLYERAIAAANDPRVGFELEVERLALEFLRHTSHRELDARVERLVDGVAGEDVAECQLLCMAAMLRHTRNRPAAEAAALAERALRHLDVELHLAPAWTMAIIVLTAADWLDETERALDRAQEFLTENGAAVIFAHVSAMRSRVHHRRGRLLAAEAHAAAAVEAVAERGLGWVMPYGGIYLADALMDRGDLEGAQAAFAALGFDGEVPSLPVTTPVLEARGRLRLLEGRPTEALDDLLEVGRRDESFGITATSAVPWSAGAARALAALGRPDEAAELALHAMVRAREWGTPRSIGTALLASGAAAAAAGERRKAVSFLEDACTRFDDARAPLESARARIALGEALRLDRQRTLAREVLREALDRAAALHAQGLVAAAHEQLRIAGAKPRRMRTSGVEALTASEMRVATLAAEGHTNVQIAQTLFVTPKTVEAHLGSVYRKLDVSSRRELPHLA